MKKGSIIAIGSELVCGDVVDTNSSYISRRLSEIGVEIREIFTVDDDLELIRSSVRFANENSDVVIITGGLGPTEDDITREAISIEFGRPLEFQPQIANQIKERFERTGLKYSSNQDRQAHLPKGAKMIENPIGTAPGWYFKEKAHIFALPGVPQEMKAMLEKSVIPILREEYESPRRLIQLQTFGIPEAAIDQMLKDIPSSFPGVQLAYRADLRGVAVKLKQIIDDLDEEIFSQALKVIKDRLNIHIYGEGEITLEQVIGDLLRKERKTLAVAESFTGGLICHRITDVPGSSDYFLKGVVAYSNQSKIELLKVKEETIRKWGAVSEETAREMAYGIREISNSDFGISTTGIAGPSGGSKEKPVGLCYIGICSSNLDRVVRRVLPGDRERIKNLASSIALDMLRRALISK